MSLRGSLESFTLQDILQLLTFSSKSGALRIAGPGEDAVVWCDAGAVTYGAVTPDEATQALVRAGLVDADVLAEALGTSEPWGEELIARGAIERERLTSFVEERVADTLYRVLLWESGEFEFVPDGQPEVGRIAALSVEPLFATALGRVAEWQALRAIVPLDGSVARLVRHLPVDVSEVAITSGLWQVIAAIDGAHAPQEIAASIGRGEFETSQALRELVERGLVEFVAAPLQALSVPSTDMEAPVAAPVDSAAETAVEDSLDSVVDSPSVLPVDELEPNAIEAAPAEISAPVFAAEPDVSVAEVDGFDAIVAAGDGALADSEAHDLPVSASEFHERSPGAALLDLPAEPSFPSPRATNGATHSAGVPAPPAPIFVVDPGGPIGASWLERWEAANVVPDGESIDGESIDGPEESPFLEGGTETFPVVVSQHARSQDALSQDETDSPHMADETETDETETDEADEADEADGHGEGGVAAGSGAPSLWSDRWASFEHDAQADADNGAASEALVEPPPPAGPSAGSVFAEEPPALPRRDSLSARREGLSDRLVSQRAPITPQGPSDDRRALSNVPALRTSSYTDRYAHLYEDLDDALGDERYERTAADLPRRASLASVGSSSEVAPSRRGRSDELPKIDRNVLLRMLSAVKDL